MQIAGRKIGPDQPPYIIAEISGNHCGKLATAMDLIRAAHDVGADAVKLQAYTPKTITIDCDKPDFIAQDGPWRGRKLYDLYKKTHTPFSWFPDLFACAKQVGITIFASVFDKSAVNMLQGLDCPAYKIASMEITDTPLIRYAHATGKPIIISTGMASKKEIGTAAMAANYMAIFLHCISGYPTPFHDADLSRMPDLPSDLYGLSDHSKGIELPIAATALGASIIEKHFMLGPASSEDAEFSIWPADFAQMCRAVHNIWQAMQPSLSPSQEASRQFRRSLYVVTDMRAGEIFTENNIRSIRPGYGAPPGRVSYFIGRRCRHDVERGTALTQDMVA